MVDVIINEQQLLSYVIHNPDELYKISDNYFLSSPSKAIYEALLVLNEQGMSFSEKHILRESNKRCKDISLEMINKLFSVDFDQGQFKNYYTRLKKDYAKNKIQTKILKETTLQVASKNELDIKAVEELIEELQEAVLLSNDEESLLMTGKQMATSYRSTLQKRREGKYKYTTGDSFLDKYLVTGATPGDITTLFAASGMAKSAYALHLVILQINKYIPSLYISLELGTIATTDRLIARKKRIPMSWLYPTDEDDVKEEAFDKAEEALKELENSEYFFFIEEPSINMTRLEKEIKDAKRRMKVDYLIVTIDLLTMMEEFSGGSPSEYEDAMNKLHAIAKRQNVHFIVVVQANRETDGANIRSIEHLDRLRPKSKKDVKNSGAMWERSRLVLSLFRPKHYAELLFPEEDETVVMDDELHVTILKQSQGRVGDILKYLFNGDTFSCYPIINKRKRG